MEIKISLQSSFIRFLAFSAIFFTAVLLTGEVLCAQERKVIFGKVTNPDDDGKGVEEVFVYAYNTVAEAQDALKNLLEARRTGSFFEPGLVVESVTDYSGAYDIVVPETGALLFYHEYAEPVLEKVDFRTEINASLSLNQVLDVSVVTADGMKEQEGVSVLVGNTLNCSGTYYFPAHLTRPNVRLVVLPYVLAQNQRDTVEYRRPIVLDGPEYNITQIRRVGYDSARDPLYRFAAESGQFLKPEMTEVSWKDSIYIDNPEKVYFYRAMIWMEDYNRVFFYKDQQFAATDRIRRPLKFLEYSVDEYQLDPMAYEEKPKIEQLATAGNISFSFLIDKEVLDPDDAMNGYYLNQLKTELSSAATSTDTALKEFHIVGVSSPEGRYEKNLQLARKRMEVILNEVTSVLSKERLDRLYKTTRAEVAPWTDVADLMEKDGHVSEARKIRNIVEEYGDMDSQGRAVRRQPFYGLVKTYLPQLRSVRYSYIQHVNRSLTPEEILAKFETDPDYRSGKKEFNRYEYWHLFDLVKDPEQLDTLCRRAYDQSVKEGNPWVYAANKLAASYIRQGIVDTLLLAPFIDTRFGVDYKIRNMRTGRQEIVNPSEVWANQLIMFLRSNNFRRANVFSSRLEGIDRYRNLVMFTKCQGGYYTGGRTVAERDAAQEVFEAVLNSSPLNKVVMLMTKNNSRYNQMAALALDELPQDAAIVSYLRATLACRKAKTYSNMMVDFELQMEAEGLLLDAFHKDERFIETAAGDGEIFEEVFEAVKALYDEEQKQATPAHDTPASDDPSSHSPVSADRLK